jgi:hypothetical protein
MELIVRAAVQVQTVLDKQRWQYCFIGGLAVQKWGQARFTQDVESVIAKQGRKLDWDYIFAQLTPLAELKEDPEIVPKLKDLRRIVEQPLHAPTRRASRRPRRR